MGGDIALVVDHTQDDFDKLIMSDDGSGVGLHIPSIMISNSDGKFIEKYVNNESQVGLNI